MEGKVMFGRSSRGHRVYGYPRPNPSGGGKAVLTSGLPMADGTVPAISLLQDDST